MRDRSVGVVRLFFIVALALGALSVARPADAAPPSPPTKQASDAQRRAKAFVEWGGSWWAAEELSRAISGAKSGEVLIHYVDWGTEHDERDGRMLIHYEGWGKEWDEVVEPARVLSLL